MNGLNSNRDNDSQEYRYHMQQPAPKTKPVRLGSSSTERGGRPGDHVFQRHIRTFAIVALCMAGFMALTVFTAIKSWQIRQRRVTKNIHEEEEFLDTRWRALQSTPGTGPLAASSSDADTIHQAELLARQAELMVAATNYREAINLYSDAIHTWPGLAPVYPKLGRLLLETRNDQRAQVILDRAAAHYPASADIHNDLGVAYLRMNRFDRALTQFQTALSIEPEHGPALFNQSLCLRATGDFNHSRVILDRYLQLRPEDPRALKEKAFFVAAEGRYEGALSILEQIMMSFPNWAPACFDAAATAALMKNPEHAIRLLRKAESLTSPAVVYLAYQQPAFNEVRLSEPGKLFQRDLVRRAQSAGTAVRSAPGTTGTPDPMLSERIEVE